MKVFILVVGLLVIMWFAALVMGLIGGGMGSATSTMAHEPLPEDTLKDSDLRDLRFDVTARGYRMGEVDAAMDRMRDEIKDQAHEIALLRAERDELTRGTTKDTTKETSEWHGGTAASERVEVEKANEPGESDEAVAEELREVEDVEVSEPSAESAKRAE